MHYTPLFPLFWDSNIFYFVVRNILNYLANNWQVFQKAFVTETKHKALLNIVKQYPIKIGQKTYLIGHL